MGSFLFYCLALLALFSSMSEVHAQTNNAQFISQSVPATMVPGQTYNVSVRMKNTGTSTWTAGTNYKLGAQNPQDNTTWRASNRVLLTASVAPGDSYTFTFPVTAPSTQGTYNFQWRMVQDGVQWFGEYTGNVAVADYNQPTLTVTRTPSPLVAGQSYTTSWSTTNATSVSYNCTASGTGFAGTATLAANGSSPGTASSAWVGYPSTCTWTATGPGGTRTVTETMTTVTGNNAQFISQSVPTNMVPGQTYNVSVTMKNTGTSTWTAGANYKLGAQNPQDNTTWLALNRVSLATSVSPV